MNLTTDPTPARPEGRRPRRRRLRDHIAVTWLVAAVVVSFVHRWVPSASWLMIHLVLLGALTHSVLVWSEHFAHTLLKTVPTEGGRRAQSARIALLGVGVLIVFVGKPLDAWWAVLAGAVLVAASVLWHATHLVVMLRKALPGRFRVVIRTYLAAAGWLPVGATFGVLMAMGLPEEWHGRLLVAHMASNLLGWVGLTVTGTLVTFWPTMLRTQMDARAERLARESLPLLVAGIAVLVIGAAMGVRPLALAGLGLYLVGLFWWGRALVRPLRAHGLREFAPASVLAALCWAVVTLGWMGWLLATADSWAGIGDRLVLVGGVAAAGFGVQLLAGALSYLIPSVMGGGPSVVRAGRAWFNRGAALRLVVINGGLLLFLLPSTSWVKVALSSLVLLALMAFIPLLLGGARASARARRAVVLKEEPPVVVERPVWSGAQFVAAAVALTVAIAAGVAVDPAAAGIGALRPAEAVAASGRTTRVEVTARGMTFTPNRIEVPAGDRLVVVLHNDDAGMAHDLMIGSARTPRIQPGATAELDAGVQTTSTEGWCTVAGHRQMGMVLDIVVVGGRPAVAASAGAPATIGPNPADTLGRTIDPVLPPLTAEKVHRLTLTVTEVPLEVAPGLWQTRWTFNGGSVGPTLHGRVGDVFEITLVNDGTMGHSIDFHAGALAPDRPMRTIAAGERLVYRFTATRAGIWMYHCATMPMTSHIAAGMHGAVVIEPNGLPAVDHSYVLVQSEVYLANAAVSAVGAREVDADKIAAERTDRVVFNGIANQYDLAPFRVKVGERVRFWVLDAGPNRASAFHIVGGQFDTVWTEGTYLLQRGRAALGGGVDGGAQVLPLQPAQGGFVELTFPEAGHYPVVSHVMIDAEKGAHGVVVVSG